MSDPPPTSPPCFVCGERMDRGERIALAGHSSLSIPPIRLHRHCAPQLATDALLQLQRLPARPRFPLQNSAAVAYALTPTEVRVLQELTLGKTNQEIAHVLAMSGQSVKNTVQRILGKLEARSRGEAAAVALRTGILE